MISGSLLDEYAVRRSKNRQRFVEKVVLLIGGGVRAIARNDKQFVYLCNRHPNATLTPNLPAKHIRIHKH